MPKAGNLFSATIFDITQFIPERYAAFRPLFEDRLRFFLDGLSPDRLASIFSDQANMRNASLGPE